MVGISPPPAPYEHCEYCGIHPGLEYEHEASTTNEEGVRFCSRKEANSNIDIRDRNLNQIQSCRYCKNILAHHKSASTDCSNDDSRNQHIAAGGSSGKHENDKQIVIIFILLIIFGSLNSIFMKLQSIPLYNYPNFVNMFGCLLFIPIMFIYIIPVSLYGWFDNAINEEQLKMSKKPFVIMGFLDCLAGMMMIFSSVYLPGPLLVLLPQAAIPFSMILSKYILKERYNRYQYIGAIIVIIGIIVVLEPLLTHRHQPDYICRAIDIDENCIICQDEQTMNDCLSHRMSDRHKNHQQKPIFMVDFELYVSTLNEHTENTNNTNNNSSSTDIDQSVCEWVANDPTTASTSGSNDEEGLLFVWSLVMIAACIPMTASSIYKEMVLSSGNGHQEIDPFYLNGWIAIFQLMFSVVLAIPFNLVASPPVLPSEFLNNVYDGFRCYAYGEGTITTGCHPDIMCEDGSAALYFNLSFIFNVIFCICMMYMLKYGSANLFYLALTSMVPIANLAFALPIVPAPTTLHFSDVLGLLVIMIGLVSYRSNSDSNESNGEPSPLLSAGNSQLDQEELGQLSPFDETAASTLQEPLLSGDI